MRNVRKLSAVKFPLSLAAAVAAVLSSTGASGASLTWDPNPLAGIQDGTGDWNNLGLTNWNDGTGNVAWNSSVPDSAIFGAGAPGTVTLTSNVTVGNITFNAAGSGYTIAAGAGFSLGLSNTIISTVTGATISAPLTGTTGLTVRNTNGTAPQTIALSGANTYSGTTTIGNGTQQTILRLDSVGALGNSSVLDVKNGSTLHVTVPNATSTTMGAGTTLTLAGNGASNNGALRGADSQSVTWAGNITIAAAGSRITGGVDGTMTVTGVISGTGSVLFSRTRNSTTILNAVNTYTGDTMIYNDSGATSGAIASLKIGVDNAINANSRLASLGAAANAWMELDLNGRVQTLRALDTSAATTALAASSLYVTNNGAAASVLTVGDANTSNIARFGGSIIDGSNEISLVKINAGTQILVGPNTYAGSTTLNGGKLQVGDATPASGNNYTGSSGSLSFTSGVTINSNATLEINNLGLSNNNDDRISDSAGIALNGGTFIYLGSDQTGVDSSETIAAITRTTGGGIGRIYGVGLGQDSTSETGVSRVFLATAPTLVGTTSATAGINAGVTNTKIVPFLLGSASAVSGGSGTIPTLNPAVNGYRSPNTFLTYHPDTGLRPLNPIDEFSSTVLDGANVRLTEGGTAAAGTAVNSLIIAGGTLTLSGTMTNTSGAFLFAQSGTSNVNEGTLDLGSTEAIMTANNGATAVIASRITGTAGITVFGEGSGTIGFGNPDSDFSGDFILRSGIAVPQTSSKGPAGAPTSGPLGTGNLIFAGGRIRGGSGETLKTIGNPVRFQENTIIEGGAVPLAFSGPVTLEGGTRTLTNGNTSVVTFSGVIGDGGNGYGLTLNGSGTGAVVLSNTNTYTGPTRIQQGRLIVSGSIAGSTTTTVGLGGTLAATLGGSGFVGNVVATGNGGPTSGATVDPGNAAGVAGILKTNAFSLTNGAHLSMQIGGVSAGGEVTTGYDQLIASGAVTVSNGDLKLEILGTPSFILGTPIFLVVNNSGSSVTGTFGTLNSAAFNPSSFTVGGQEFQLVYNASFSGAGSDGIANDIAIVAVPEPGTAALLIGGLGVLGLRRRRQHR